MLKKLKDKPVTMGGGVEVKYHPLLAPEFHRDVQRHAPVALSSRNEWAPTPSGIKPSRPARTQALH